MSRFTMRTAALGAVSILTLTLAACGGGAASSAPASSAAEVPSLAIAACSETKDAGVVAVAIKDFKFNPADISAKVGEVIAFTNDDSAGHTASLVDGSCTTPTIASGTSDGLVFTVAGSYPFQCNIHTNMKGTITIS
jgi:plastocyanin